MILYHFTAAEYLESILKDGLNRGDVPLSPTEGVNGVWLTTDPNTEGHGLTDGGPLTAREHSAYALAFGREPPISQQARSEDQAHDSEYRSPAR